MMVVYSKTNGRAHDLRIVPADYVLQLGEVAIDRDELPPIETLHDQPTAADHAASKMAEVNAKFEAAAAQLTGDYPESEKLTWPIQEQEALAWRTSSTAATPYIDALAAARGIARVDYLNRTLAKVDTFRAASANLVGKRQRYEDAVKVAQQAGDVASIDAVNPVF